MGRNLSVDWAEVRDISQGFLNNANQLKDAGNELNSILEQIKGCWLGTDANNYIESSIKTVNELYSESEYLTAWNEYLVKASDIYGSKFDESYARFQSIESSFSGNE